MIYRAMVVYSGLGVIGTGGSLPDCAEQAGKQEIGKKY